MVKQLAPYIVLAIFNVLMLGGFSVATYRTPRNLFISLASFGLLGWWVYGASFIPLTGLGLTLVLGLLAWWILCTLFSTRTDLSIPAMIPIIGTVVVCGLMEFNLTGIAILCGSIGLNCIYAILQNGLHHKYKLRWDIFKDGSHKGYPIGFSGNTIHLSIMCMVYVFLSVYLVLLHHWAWGFLTVLFLYTMYLTRCRTALVGLCVGGLYVLGCLNLTLFVITLAVMFLVAIMWKQLPNYLTNNSTLQERLKYWKIGSIQITQSPVFGIGVGVYGTKVPFIQRLLRDKITEKTLYPNHTRVHNDYIQHAIDFGIIGFIGYISYLTFVVSLGIATQSIEMIILTGALIGLLTSGMFFNYLDIAPLRPLLWMVSFFILQLTTSNVGTQLSPWLWIGVVVYGLFTLRFMIKELAADMAFAPYYGSNCNVPPLPALVYKPNLTMARSRAVGRYLLHGDPWQAFHHAIHAIKLYDGDQVYWELWNNLGVVFMSTQCFNLAEKCFEHSLGFCPTYESSLRNLKLIADLKKQARRVEV